MEENLTPEESRILSFCIVLVGAAIIGFLAVISLVLVVIQSIHKI